ncbi:MAG: FAD-dependent oxidoreductase [Vicinamibacteria bacterium]|nr:FAD-dependent oxidoreductase [Vicinamibacteria bacterium]
MNPKLSRRTFVGAAVTAGAAATTRGQAEDQQPATARSSSREPFDVAIVGAGVFGAWTAWHLQSRGKRVALIDAYGPGSSRASSGGETRVIRMGYGSQEIYTRMSWDSLAQWKKLQQATGERLFTETGMLFMARERDALTMDSLATLEKLGIPHEKLERADLVARYRQIDFGPITWALSEPRSGALFARRAVQVVVREFQKAGGELILGRGEGPATDAAVKSLKVGDRSVQAASFVFACGPWLGKLFPDVLGDRIFPTRQEVFYFGVPPGDDRFGPPKMPTWIDFGAEIYGLPDLETKGFKVAIDKHGPRFDPDSGERLVTAESTAIVKSFVAERFPGLKDAPIVGSEVCQYENSSNGDFLVDQHPRHSNVWLVGGGSGHGFKHGPALGAYVADRLTKGGPTDPKFSLATKDKFQARVVH